MHTLKAAAFVLLMNLCACSVPSFSPVNRPAFYILQSPSLTQPAAGQPALSILPPLLPGYLERSQLVTRDRVSAEIHVREFDLWGEELGQGMTRVLCDALANRGVNAMPLSAGMSSGMRLTLDVRRFDGDPQGAVRLEAVWTIRKDGSVLHSARFNADEDAGGDLNGMVRAMSRLTGRMAADIAGALGKS